MYNEIMDKKTIEPLNNNIEIEENKSFASRENQQKASDVYQENTQKEALAIETRNLLCLCFLCIVHKKIVLLLFGFSSLRYKFPTIISENHA